MNIVEEYLYNLASGKIKGPVAALLKCILLLFSLIYWLAVVILAGFYRIKPIKFKAKVISVGNITLGGTGKTAFVEYLADKLHQEKRKIAILSRGYKRNSKKNGADALGDEPLMLKEKLSFANIVVDKDRVRGASRAIKDFNPDTLILDDGMQQWRIFKDLEIIMIDAGNPFGNLHLLPAGFLREPLSALARADIFVLTQIQQGHDISPLITKLKNINRRALIVESTHQPVGFNLVNDPNQVLPLDFFKNKKAIIFSGIGNPQSFENTISALGINVAKAIRFSDHYDYTCDDIFKIIQAAHQENLDAIITTAKDAVKITELGIKSADISVLNVKIKIIKDETEFNNRLLKLYSI